MKGKVRIKRKRKKLNDASSALVYDIFLKTFYGEKVNFFMAFYIFPIKIVSTFLKWFINNCSNGTRDPQKIIY